jgi:Amt family ammonium transporter
VAIGATVLLFGWFGFNTGSALAADGLAVHAFATTALAAASAELGWMLMDVIFDRKPTLVGACTGLVVGLVAITPGCGYVPLGTAMPIGLVGSVICYFTCSRMKARFGCDDALDAFGCHGIGGVWGGIATGIFASKAVNPNLSWDGLIYGDVRLLGVQLASTVLVAVVGTLACILIVHALCGGAIRVSEREEREGLDLTQHGERAYPSFMGLDD